jgi:hypothetical protein
MAAKIVVHAKTLPPGTVAAVIGNDAVHAERLVTLVQQLAKQSGFNISHVTLKPVGSDDLAAADKARGVTH